MSVDINKLRNKLERGEIRCPKCEKPLPPDIDMYPHPGGQPVKGNKKKMWVSIPCHNCHYDWAAWKLGIK